MDIKDLNITSQEEVLLYFNKLPTNLVDRINEIDPVNNPQDFYDRKWLEDLTGDILEFYESISIKLSIFDIAFIIFKAPRSDGGKKNEVKVEKEQEINLDGLIFKKNKDKEMEV